MLHKVTKVDTKLPLNSGPQRIYLNSRVFALVDPDDYDLLSKFHWHLKQSNGCFYALRRAYKNGYRFWIRMHREVMRAPLGFVVHHKNRNTLDNRKSNLEVLTDEEHKLRKISR